MLKFLALIISEYSTTFLHSSAFCSVLMTSWSLDYSHDFCSISPLGAREALRPAAAGGINPSELTKLCMQCTTRAPCYYPFDTSYRRKVTAPIDNLFKNVIVEQQQLTELPFQRRFIQFGARLRRGWRFSPPLRFSTECIMTQR